MNSEEKQSAKPGWREFFLLEQRLAAAQRASFKSSDPGWPQFALGRGVLSDANELAGSPDGIGSALLLYRAALVLFANAHRGRAAQPGSASGGGLSAPDTAALEALPEEERSLVRTAFDADPPEEHFAKLAEGQRQLTLSGLQHVARDLGDALEKAANEVPRVKLQRFLRSVVLPGLVVVAIVWLAVKVFEPPNLALNKGVSVSSLWSDQYSSQNVVDGDREEIGFHTQCAANQWVSIDLAKVETLERIDVYNRTDCCRERAVPLRLELSTDGETFTSVEQRTNVFDKWTVKLEAVPARFLRLTNESNNCFHLAEIEAY